MSALAPRGTTGRGAAARPTQRRRAALATCVVLAALAAVALGARVGGRIIDRVVAGPRREQEPLPRPHVRAETGERAAERPAGAAPAEAQQARDVTVRCETTKGAFRMATNGARAPKSVAALLAMVRGAWFRDVPFFRVNEEITQFGVRPREFKFPLREWERDLNPEPERAKREPWVRGDVSMIGGPQMVIVKRGNARMGVNDHDAVVARVPPQDMRVIDALYAYNDVIDHPKRGPGPDQARVHAEGWEYLKREFPLVDMIVSCGVEGEGESGEPQPVVDAAAAS